MRRRAVVLLEPDDLGAREIGFEAQDVADLGAAPAIDRLVVVADAAQIAVLLRQEAEPQILRDIRVLVFVHQDIAEALLVLLEDRRIGAEQRQVVQQEVAEIGGVERQEPLLVEPVERDGAASRDLARLGVGHLVGDEAAVLPALEQSVERARRRGAVVHALGLGDLLDEAQLVVRVQNREIGFEAHRLGVAAQDARRDRMERAEPEPVGGAADHALEPLLHLERRLVGEGDGDDLRREGAPRAEDIGEPRRQHARLARAGAGQHQDRSLDRFDGRALRLVEPGEKRRLDGRDGMILHGKLYSLAVSRQLSAVSLSFSRASCRKEANFRHFQWPSDSRWLMAESG